MSISDISNISRLPAQSSEFHPFKTFQNKTEKYVQIANELYNQALKDSDEQQKVEKKLNCYKKLRNGPGTTLCGVLLMPLRLTMNLVCCLLTCSGECQYVVDHCLCGIGSPCERAMNDFIVGTCYPDTVFDCCCYSPSCCNLSGLYSRNLFLKAQLHEANSFRLAERIVNINKLKNPDYFKMASEVIKFDPPFTDQELDKWFLLMTEGYEQNDTDFYIRMSSIMTDSVHRYTNLTLSVRQAVSRFFNEINFPVALTSHLILEYIIETEKYEIENSQLRLEEFGVEEDQKYAAHANDVIFHI